MEIFVVKLVAFFRPLASVEYLSVAFDVFGIGLFAALAFVFIGRNAVRKDMALSPVDVAIIVLTLWCIATFIIYFEGAKLRHLAKLLIPLLSYIVVKNVVQDRSQYVTVLKWAIAGFALPVVASVVLILAGMGVDYVSFWTGLTRWRGAYLGSHSMGHSMTLLLMMLVIYNVLADHEGKRGRGLRLSVSGVLAVLALYCLYQSQVRSAILGLLVFGAVYLFFTNKRRFFIGAGALAGIAAVTMPYWLPALLPDVVTVQMGVSDASEIGSGRLQYWKHNLAVFAQLPFDQKLAGIGIGDIPQTMYVGEDEALDSHNDWLDMLMQTGLIGLLMFMVLQILIFRAVLRMPTTERYLFLALFLAVLVMMFVSNSYTWRIQVGHLYYITLAYIEIAARRASRATVTLQAVPGLTAR